jgi:hypothetical protein
MLTCWLQHEFYKQEFELGTVFVFDSHTGIELHNKSPIFGPKREEVTGYWRKLHSEEFHNLYSSQNIIGMNKSRRM